MDKRRIYNKNTDIVPDDAVLVDRITRYGNPFKLGSDGNLAQVTVLYIDYLKRNPALVEDIRLNLKGKSLVCWCWPDRCHAEVLLKLSNDPHFNLDSMI